MSADKKHFLKVLAREVSQCRDGAKLKGYLRPPIHFMRGILVLFFTIISSPVVNLVKHFTIVIYDYIVVLTTKLPILRL